MPDMLRRFARDCPSAIALVGADGRIAYANPAFAALGVLSPACAAGPVGVDVASVMADPALARALCREVERAREKRGGSVLFWDGEAMAQGTEVQGTDVPSGSQGGAGLWIRLVAPAEPGGECVLELRPVIPEDPASLGLALAAEREARMAAERVRHVGRKLLFEIIEQLPIFVYMQRPDYTVAYANKKARDFYGDYQGRLCYELFSGRDSPCPFCPTFRVFDTGRPEDWHFTDLDGRTFHIFDYPFEDEDGEPLVMELGIDITELKRVERELVQAHKMRAIGVLAGGIAHDLNNNLVPIIFNIDYALGKPGTDAANEALGEALRAAYRAADLVRQVLEYSRQQNVSRAPLHLTPLVREHLALFSASLPTDVELVETLEAERDGIKANPAQVQQLVLNLCRNGVQAMPDGGTLTVRIRNESVSTLQDLPHPSLGLGDYVVLEVEDTGHGMDAETAERIFEPFYTSKKGEGGTGMGLAVVHAIVMSSGGAIHVCSEPGRGAVFTAWLPSEEPAAAPIKARPSEHASKRGRLLVVDDDRSALRAMVRVLREGGFTVSTADSGEEGLEAYREADGNFDLVLADHSMPGMTGVEMADRILERDAGARIVICTGHVGADLEKQALDAGVAGFALKPMTPWSLVETVRRYSR